MRDDTVSQDPAEHVEDIEVVELEDDALCDAAGGDNSHCPPDEFCPESPGSS